MVNLPRCPTQVPGPLSELVQSARLRSWNAPITTWTYKDMHQLDSFNGIYPHYLGSLSSQFPDPVLQAVSL